MGVVFTQKKTKANDARFASADDQSLMEDLMMSTVSSSPQTHLT
jgi:hypothetical protein